MGIFGKVVNGINAANALGDALGIKTKSKKTKEAVQQNPRAAIAQARESTAGLQGLIYPKDLGDQCFIMNFKEYQYKADSIGVGPLKRTSTSISLPFPKELKQAYRVDYAQEQVGPYAKEAIDEVSNLIGGGSVANGIQGLNNALSTASLGDTAQAIAAGAGVAARAAGRATLSAIAGGVGIKTGIGLLAGVVENPNDRALLKGIPLREHSFTWTLSPRNSSELAELKKIYSTIRQKMHPKRTGLGQAQFALQFPYVVDVAFLNGLQMSFFKTSVITGFEMDMAPGAPTFFQGDEAEPVVYNMTLQLLELEAIDALDFVLTDGGV